MNSCLLIGWFGLFSGGQNEVGAVLEHPVVFEGVVDDSQEFARQCDVSDPGPASERFWHYTPVGANFSGASLAIRSCSVASPCDLTAMSLKY